MKPPKLKAAFPIIKAFEVGHRLGAEKKLHKYPKNIIVCLFPVSATLDITIGTCGRITCSARNKFSWFIFQFSELLANEVPV